MLEKQIYTTLANRYTTDLDLIGSFWKEIEEKYSELHRHYHTLAHLDFLITQLQQVKGMIADWDTVLFSVFYHDIVYSTTANDNEEKSAELAIERLKQIVFPAEKIAKCHKQILATKGHTITNDNDTDLFTDADLSILGQPQEAYAIYAKQIRSEYAQYPGDIYKAGRKKVLQHFLAMERIYKNGYFFDRFELKARENLLHELTAL